MEGPQRNGSAGTKDPTCSPPCDFDQRGRHRLSSLPNVREKLESVLCIDDDRDTQQIVKISLERIGGIKLHICTDPHHALQSTRDVAPDLILLDFLMPGLDGMTLFRRLQ